MQPQPAQPRVRPNVRYEQALSAYDAVLTPTEGLIRQLEWAGTDYALSPEGEQRLAADAEAAERVGNFERSALLTQCINKGRLRRSAAVQVRQVLSQSLDDQEPAPPGMRSWKANDPIWPNVETMEDAFRHSQTPADKWSEIKRAYRALYAANWKQMFTSEDGARRQPDSDSAGWQWRKEAIERTAKGFFGAHLIPLPEAKAGMVVYNGYRIVEIKAITEGLPQEISGLDRQRHQVAMFHVMYTDGQSEGPLPATSIWVRLPQCETKTEN